MLAVEVVVLGVSQMVLLLVVQVAEVLALIQVVLVQQTEQMPQ